MDKANCHHGTSKAERTTITMGDVKGMMEEIAKYGTPTTKRIYADWTKPNANGWKSVLLEHAITPIQQYSYTVGKNSSDSAMIIDAMDLLYSDKVDGFCIVSSDSDFTRLAIRLRESGMNVIGMGEKKTPNSFIVACDRFIYIEVLQGAFKNKVTKTTTHDTKKTVEKGTREKEVVEKSYWWLLLLIILIILLALMMNIFVIE
jgi:uncharacterized LabA/DUF88 family protein